MGKAGVVGAVLVLMSTTAACLPREVRTSPTYLGHDEEVVAPRRVPARRVFIEVEDLRANPTLLGEDTSRHVPIYGDPTGISRLTLDGFRTEFAHVGIPVARSQGEADRVVRVVLTSVKVEEGFSYSANFTAVLEVSTGAGAPIGRTQIDGMGMRFGGDDYSGPEVNAVLNNALAKLIANALANVEFLRMLVD